MPTVEPSVGSRTVLIVDDVEESRDLLMWQLERDSQLHVIGQAADGQEAVARAAELQPDLVVLDLNMPRRDGLTTIPQLYNVAPRTRVVVLTSYNSQEALHAAADLGAVKCLLKGMRRADLLSALHRALGLAD
ncbi:response regulator transcription factor [Nocardioides aurantiacus]|nr:response regulator transcription factor [Nocardioides aurantiacus]